MSRRWDSFTNLVGGIYTTIDMMDLLDRKQVPEEIKGLLLGMVKSNGLCDDLYCVGSEERRERGERIVR